MQTDSQKNDFFYKDKVIQKDRLKVNPLYFKITLYSALLIITTSIAIQTFISFQEYHSNKIQQDIYLDKLKQLKINQQYKQNIDFVNSVSQEEFNHLIKFIDSSRNDSQIKANELYWKIKYINQVNPNLDTQEVAGKINDLKFDIDSYYEERKIGFLTLYYNAKRNLFIPEKTSNDYDIYEIFSEHWINVAKIDNDKYYYRITELDKIISAFVKDKDDYIKFLNDNKDKVELSKQFFIQK